MKTNSLAGLIDALKNTPEPRDARAIREMFEAFPLIRDEAEAKAVFDERKYTRATLLSTEQLELLLLCWRPGQISPIHDHAGSACIVRVISGTATEIIYEPAPNGLLYPRIGTRLSEGSITVSIDSDTHQIGNLEPMQNLLTLHCYTPPLAKMRRFGINESCLLAYCHSDEQPANP
jgi:cysteine dioxygenase